MWIKLLVPIHRDNVYNSLKAKFNAITARAKKTSHDILFIGYSEKYRVLTLKDAFIRININNPNWNWLLKIYELT